jgi:hypothetical protein
MPETFWPSPPAAATNPAAIVGSNSTESGTLYLHAGIHAGTVAGLVLRTVIVATEEPGSIAANETYGL